MVWTVVSDKSQREEKKDGDDRSFLRLLWSRRLLLPWLLTLSAAAVVTYYFFWWQPSEEQHPVIRFEDRFKEVCQNPKLPMPAYEGVQSFFDYIQKPETDFCYSWIEFGGERLPVASQTEEECNDEVRKAKYICFNDEYKMNLDPCLVYSFDKDMDSQFERDMHLFSCEVHSFDVEEVTAGEHVQRTEFWFEHAWEIAEFPYNLPAEKDPKKKGITRFRRSLDFITTMLGHKGKEIKFLKSDVQGREWMLLRQIVTYQEYADIRQIGLRLHLPTKTASMTAQERHDAYKELFQVLQGLTCTGYRFLMARPIKYYKGGIYVPEMNQTFFPAYEVNFAKDLNIAMELNI